MDIRHLTRIASSKGLRLLYDTDDEVYVLYDRGALGLMSYAPITMKLINEAEWREELNKLKIQR
jgi:hypothetical protein